MATFNTPRQLTADEKLKALIEAKTHRNESIASIKATQAMEAEEACKAKAMEEIDAENEEKEATEAALAEIKKKEHFRKSRFARIQARQNLVTEGVNLLKRRVLFEMAYNAYNMDDELKARPDIIAEAYDNFKKVEAIVESVCAASKETGKTQSRFLDAVDDVISYVAEAAAQRILEKAEVEDEEDITFELTDEEQKDLDMKLSDLGKDEIEDLIKEKVVSVVNDEKEAGEKKAEFFKQLEPADDGDGEADGKEDGQDESGSAEENGDDSKKEEGGEAESNNEGGSDDDNKADDEVDKSVKEGMEEVPSVSDHNPDDMQNSVKAIKESADVRLGRLIADKKRRELNKSIGGTLFESLLIYNTKHAKEIAVTEGVDTTQNQIQSAALIETVFDYTVLETFDTLGIYKFTGADVNAIRANLMGRVRGTIEDAPVEEGGKSVRIHTLKFKRNNDHKVMSSNGGPVTIGGTPFGK